MAAIGAKTLLDWDRVQTVLLDMDGTLLDLEFDNFFWREHVPSAYARRHGISLAEAQSELLPRYARYESTLQWYCLDHWSRELEMDVLALKHELRERIRFLPDVEPFLAGVRRLGKRLVLVTNAHRDSLALKAAQTGLQAYFDALVSSHDIGYPKERVEFWHGLRGQESFSREQTLLIDDSLPVLRAARDYGLQQLIVVSRPDSAQPARQIDEFPAVDSIADLLA